MHVQLADRAVLRKRVRIHLDDHVMSQGPRHALLYPGLRPAVEAYGDRTPVAEPTIRLAPGTGPLADVHPRVE